MPTAVNWVSQVITSDKADLTQLAPPPNEVRELNLDTFHRDLRLLEASEAGIVYPRTHNYVGPITVGSVTLAPVVEIINGYTWTPEDGQYAANLNGANTNLQDVTNVNQVSVRPNNSAGLTFSKQTEDQSFTDARVWINTAGAGQPGQSFPIGTPGTPVDNLTDALAIIQSRNLPKRIQLRGPLVIGGAGDISEFDIAGSSPILASLDVQAGALTDGLVVTACTITGDLAGNLTANKATTLVDTLDLEGKLESCGIDGTLTIADNSVLTLESCYSEVAGTAKPILQMGANSTLLVRNYSGGLEIRNMTAGCIASVDLDPGRFRLDHVSNTGGEISIKGLGDFLTTPAVLAAVTVDIDGLLNTQLMRIAQQSMVGRAIVSLDDLTVTIYDEEGANVLRVLDISADERQRTPQ